MSRRRVQSSERAAASAAAPTPVPGTTAGAGPVPTLALALGPGPGAGAGALARAHAASGPVPAPTAGYMDTPGRASFVANLDWRVYKTYRPSPLMPYGLEAQVKALEDTGMLREGTDVLVVLSVTELPDNDAREAVLRTLQRGLEDKLTYDPALKQRYKLGDVVHAGRGTFDYYVNNCSPMQSQTSLLYVTTVETPSDTLRANVAKYGFETDDRKARALAEQELLIDAATSEVDADNEPVLRVDFGARDDQETAVELYSPVRLLRTGSGAYDGRVKFEIVNRTTNSGL